MEFNKLALAGLALGCLATAAGGAYLATRHNTAERASVTAAVSAAAPVIPDPTVTESEGILDPIDAPASVAESAPAPAAETARPAPRPAAVERPAARRAAPPPVRAVPPPVEPAAEVAVAPGGSMWEPRVAVEPERPALPIEPAEPVREYVDLVIPADAVLGLQIERTISSELARVEDRVEARVTRDVRVDDRVAIPAGAMAYGSVTDVELGGKVRERARLAIRFHTVVLADGTRLALSTDPIVREGQSPGGESAAKIGGGALGGAIVGGILGGRRGAAIGGTVGAAGGTAAVMTGDRNPAILPAGSTLTVRIQDPVRVTVEK
jgi:hypothetical protein